MSQGLRWRRTTLASDDEGKCDSRREGDVVDETGIRTGFEEDSPGWACRRIKGKVVTGWNSSSSSSLGTSSFGSLGEINSSCLWSRC